MNGRESVGQTDLRLSTLRLDPDLGEMILTFHVPPLARGQAISIVYSPEKIITIEKSWHGGIRTTYYWFYSIVRASHFLYPICPKIRNATCPINFEIPNFMERLCQNHIIIVQNRKYSSVFKIQGFLSSVHPVRLNRMDNFLAF